ncbi:hypothetical protein C2I18_00385 [Paenibacillus sp. PK3_47]|uniref:DUF4097 domain-containing protein n=1 Tax=Paenibacillus sp. PK3_47 TaxID=2072642 RepID=UPI00201D744C|nr:DUF4097 domain-containing protein [Paenibacillus sp. PK3_47]UQZ32142.1 hypothetical protein C2I18_00385 [Paenibacillus sp. PK3_47]
MRKNNHTAAIAAAAVLSLVLLAGCRELPGKEAANHQLEQSFSGESGQELNEAGQETGGSASDLGSDIEAAVAGIGEGIGNGISKAMDSVGYAVQNTAEFVSDEIKADGISTEFSASAEAGSASVLVLDNAVGQIEVVPSDSDQVHVTATVISNKSRAKFAAELPDKAEVSVKASGDKLTVSTHAKEKPAKDLWSWAQKEYGASDFTIDYVIEIPSSIGQYEINNNVGTIQLYGLQGNFHIVSDVGEIVLNDVEIAGKSTVQSDTGSISLDIRDMQKGSSLKASSNIGTVSADLAANLQCTVEAKSDLGEISGTGKGRQDFNGGGPLLSLSTDIGSISVQN